MPCSLGPCPSPIAPFAPVAGLGDMLIAALAVPLAVTAAARGTRDRRAWLRAWNGLGALDLVVAVSLVDARHAAAAAIRALRARRARAGVAHEAGAAAVAGLVLARAHVATKNGAIMISMGIINAATNAIGNLVLIRFLGLEGIALSTSTVQLVIAIVFWFRFEARLASLRAAPPPNAEQTRKEAA